jgi:hypothetical protein
VLGVRVLPSHEKKKNQRRGDDGGGEEVSLRETM